MRTLGIDFGDKRIGVAVSDPLGLIASGVATIQKGETFAQDIEELKKVMAQYSGIEEIVVGLPKLMSGAAGVQVEKVLRFVEALKQAVDLKVVTADERLTTKAAERTLIEAGLSREKRKKVIDKSAAAAILQGYLDRKAK